MIKNLDFHENGKQTAGEICRDLNAHLDFFTKKLLMLMRGTRWKSTEEAFHSVTSRAVFIFYLTLPHKISVCAYQTRWGGHQFTRFQITMSSFPRHQSKIEEAFFTNSEWTSWGIELLLTLVWLTAAILHNQNLQVFSKKKRNMSTQVHFLFRQKHTKWHLWKYRHTSIYIQIFEKKLLCWRSTSFKKINNNEISQVY